MVKRRRLHQVFVFDSTAKQCDVWGSVYDIQKFYISAPDGNTVKAAQEYRKSVHTLPKKEQWELLRNQRWVSYCLGFLFWYGRMFSRVSLRKQNVFPVVASSLRSQVNYLFTWKKPSRRISSSPSFLLPQSVNVSLFGKYCFTKRHESDENKVLKKTRWLDEWTSEWVSLVLVRTCLLI